MHFTDSAAKSGISGEKGSDIYLRGRLTHCCPTRRPWPWSSNDIGLVGEETDELQKDGIT